MVMAVWRGVGSIVRKCGEGFVVATRTTATACTRTPSGGPPLGGGPGRAPKGEDSVERGARAGYTGERARSPSIIPSVTSNLGTRFFHSQSVQSHGSCLNGYCYIKNVVLFEENSILLLPECLEASGVESVWGEVSQESPKNR